MRATEYLHSVNNGIQETELYSHLDVENEDLRKEIAKKRREIKKAQSRKE